MEFRQPLLPDLQRHQVSGDDSLHLAASFQHGVGYHTHQTHTSAAVDQSNVSSYQFLTHLLGGSAVLRTATLTGAAENADSFHAAILNFGWGNEPSPPYGKPRTTNQVVVTPDT